MGTDKSADDTYAMSSSPQPEEGSDTQGTGKEAQGKPSGAMQPPVRGNEPRSQPPIPTKAIAAPSEMGETVHVLRSELARLEGLVDLRPGREAREFASAAWAAVGVAVTAGLAIAAYYGTDKTLRPPHWESTAAWGLLAFSSAVAVVAALAAHLFGRVDRNANAMLKAAIARLDYARQDGAQRRKRSSRVQRGWLRRFKKR
jgi:hypothetical protein